MVTVSRRAVRTVVSAALVGMVFAVGPSLPSPAYAVLSTCRSDPVVALSNGAVIDLQAGISDSTSDVGGITYTVHVPAGLRVVGIVNTDGLVGLVEKVQVYADSPPRTYRSVTAVSTGAPNVSVTATTTVVSALNLTLGSRSAAGTSGQSLTVQFTSLL